MRIGNQFSFMIYIHRFSKYFGLIFESNLQTFLLIGQYRETLNEQKKKHMIALQQFLHFSFFQYMFAWYNYNKKMEQEQFTKYLTFTILQRETLDHVSCVRSRSTSKRPGISGQICDGSVGECTPVPCPARERSNSNFQGCNENVAPCWSY